MKALKWSLVKSQRLKKTRGVSFEELIESRLVTVLKHPKHTHQRVMLFWHRQYIWVVPFVATEKEYFLKTLYPSRKYTRQYRQGDL